MRPSELSWRFPKRSDADETSVPPSKRAKTVDEVEYTSLDKVSQIETNRYEVNVFAVIMCDAAPPSVTRFDQRCLKLMLIDETLHSVKAEVYTFELECPPDVARKAGSIVRIQHGIIRNNGGACILQVQAPRKTQLIIWPPGANATAYWMCRPAVGNPVPDPIFTPNDMKRLEALREWWNHNSAEIERRATVNSTKPLGISSKSNSLQHTSSEEGHNSDSTSDVSDKVSSSSSARLQCETNDAITLANSVVPTSKKVLPLNRSDEYIYCKQKPSITSSPPPLPFLNSQECPSYFKIRCKVVAVKPSLPRICRPVCTLCNAVLGLDDAKQNPRPCNKCMTTGNDPFRWKYSYHLHLLLTDETACLPTQLYEPEASLFFAHIPPCDLSKNDISLKALEDLFNSLKGGKHVLECVIATYILNEHKYYKIVDTMMCET